MSATVSVWHKLDEPRKEVKWTGYRRPAKFPAVRSEDLIIGLPMNNLTENDVGQCRQVNRANHRHWLIL